LIGFDFLLGDLIGFDLIIFISTKKIILISLVCNIYDNQTDQDLLTQPRIVKLENIAVTIEAS